MDQQLSTILKKSISLPARDEMRSAPAARKPDLQARLAAALPWALLIGFISLTAVVLGDRLIPARSVEVTTVVTRQASIDDSPPPTVTADAPAADPYRGPLLFQASGWVEPDPYPIMATALTSGVIDEVHVLEGETVTEDQVLVTLVAEDAALNLETAQQRLASLKAQAMAHNLQVTGVEARIATLEKRVKAAKAREKLLADPARRLREIEDRVVREQDVVEAQLALEAQKAQVEALQAERDELLAEKARLEAGCISFEAQVKEAKTAVARAQLALDRTKIKSPINGAVSRLMAQPGDKKMLEMDDKESATVAILYDPKSLQARIDVPLAEAGKLEIGQPVLIRTNLLPDQEFKGTVTRIVGEADLQRNTLQAKVAIHNPDPRLRPEMLCRGEFLTPPEPDSPSGPHRASQPSRVEVFVPEAALTRHADSSAVVWTVNGEENRAEPREITLLPSDFPGHWLVREGLKPGERLVLNPPANLSSGERLRPQEPSL